MAFLTLDRKKLSQNYKFLDDAFKDNDIEWATVSKLLCGNEEYIKELIDCGTREICDSRISNLEIIKSINPDIKTVYIKPPAISNIEEIVKFADASFNTEYDTISALSKEAQKQNKTHKVIIMIELGDLREGIMGDHLIEFYEKVFQLPNIEISGIGANLNCLHGVMPSEDKLIQLSLYKQLIEARFGKKIEWVTGGTSVVLPLLFRKQIPDGINHFRIGETLFFGADLFEDDVFEGMHDDVFKLYAEIIEITEKPRVPIGVLETNPSGDSYEIDEEDYGKTSQRAIIDIGLLDISPDFLIPEDGTLDISGASSDMLILDLEDTKKEYNVGDLLGFKLKYMGALRLMNSNYIDKKVIK